MSDDTFVELVLHDYEDNIDKSRKFFTKMKESHMIKYIKIPNMKAEADVRQTKVFFEAIVKRLNLVEEVEMIRYVNFLSALVSNYHFDDGFRNIGQRQNSYVCPCSKNYCPWYETLDIEGTISVSTKNHVFQKSASFMNHIVSSATGEGTGFQGGGTDLYHYLILCYIYQLYGETAIGAKGLELITGVKSSKKSKKKKSLVSTRVSRVNEHCNELCRSDRGKFNVERQRK